MRGKSKDIIFYISICTVLLSFVSVIYAICTYGLASIHSDNTASLRLFNSIVEHKNLYPKTWNGANGEIYSFHTVLIAIISYWLFGGNPRARILAAIFSVCLFCVCVIWFSKKVLRNYSFIFILPIYLVYLCVYDMSIYGAAYISPMIALTLCFGMINLIVFEGSKSRFYIILHSMCLILMTLGGMRYIAEYVLPLICTIIIKSVLNKECRANFLKYGLLSVGIPSIFGFGLYRYICFTHNMNSTDYNGIELITSVDSFIENVKKLLNCYAAVFGYSENASTMLRVCSVFVPVVVCLLIPILQLKDLKKASKVTKTYFLFGVIHNIVLGGVLLLASKVTERYLLSSIYVFIIISANYLANNICKLRKIVRVLLIILFTLLTAFYSTKLIKSTSGWYEIYKSQVEISKALVNKSVVKGYGTFWNAYNYEVYSNNKIQFGEIKISDRDLRKTYWLVDNHAFEKSEGRSCILMTKEENEKFSNTVYVLVGTPDEDLIINDVFVFDVSSYGYVMTDLYVYIYNEDICGKLNDGLWDNYCDIWEMDFNWVGTMTQNSILLDCGGIVHGPYDSLKEGHYTIRIDGDNLLKADADVVSQNMQENLKYRVKTVTDTYIEIDLYVKDGVDDIQFYLMNNVPDSQVKFYDVSVNEI